MKRMWDKKALQGSTAQIVETMVESGELDNAKPIFCHPINLTIITDANNYATLTMLIFNNDETAFTWATFNTWLNSLVADVTNARIMISGSICISGSVSPANYIYANDSTRQIVAIPSYAPLAGINISYDKATWEALTPAQFTDGVNKIN